MVCQDETDGVEGQFLDFALVFLIVGFGHFTVLLEIGDDVPLMNDVPLPIDVLIEDADTVNDLQQFIFD